VAAVVIAAVASLQQIGRGKDEVRAFIIKIFESEGWRRLAKWCGFVGFGGIRHC
jgi:hypothetical protein